MPLLHMCHRLFSSHSNQHQLAYSRNSDASKPGHPTSSLEPSDNQRTAADQTSCIVVDEQNSSTSKQLHFIISRMKHFNPPSVASATCEESAQNISGPSRILGIMKSVLSYQQMDTTQPFSTCDSHQHAASPPTTTTTEYEPTQQPAKTQLIYLKDFEH